MTTLRICCISDTHERHADLAVPTCDILLHAGDLTMMGEPEAILSFDRWVGELIRKERARHVVAIAGNHDFLFQHEPRRARNLLQSAVYLQDSEAELYRLRIWGTPWQPWFYDWAFNLRHEDELAREFQKIPLGTDILLCHSPPKGILDSTHDGRSTGSSSLLSRIQQVRPKLVVFGHIHESYGKVVQDGIIYVNASTCNLNYDPENPPIVIELEV